LELKRRQPWLSIVLVPRAACDPESELPRNSPAEFWPGRGTFVIPRPASAVMGLNWPLR
jgi:hypothetical protein